MTTKIGKQSGYYVIRIIVLIALANLFLNVLLSFATSIKMAKSALSNNSAYNNLSTLLKQEVNPMPDYPIQSCQTEKLRENLQFTTCIEASSNKTITFFNEKYEAP